MGDQVDWADVYHTVYAWIPQAMQKQKLQGLVYQHRLPQLGSRLVYQQGQKWFYHRLVYQQAPNANKVQVLVYKQVYPMRQPPLA